MIKISNDTHKDISCCRHKGGRPVVFLVFIVAFLCILSIPFGLNILSLAPAPIPINENRRLALKVDLLAYPLKKLPSLLDAYFKDSLAFRSHLIYSYIRIWEGFLEAPLHLFVTGKSGELFLRLAPPTFLYALGLEPLSQDRLVQTKLSYAAMQAYFSIHGIYYLVVTIPDKTAIYSESFPFWTNWKRGEGHYSQLRSALKYPINILHLQEHLEQGKKEFRPYNVLFDPTHWNANGIKIAYDEIVRTLSSHFLEFKAVEEGLYYRRDFAVRTYHGYGQEKVPFIEILKQDNFENHTSNIKDIFPQQGWDAAKLLINTENTTNLTLWMATDSYLLGTHTIPSKHWYGTINPLAHHVKQYLHMHYGNMDIPTIEKLFKKHKPDIVVEAFAERAGHAGRAADPRIRILGDALLNTPGHILSGSLMPAGIAAHNAHIHPVENMGQPTNQLASSLDTYIITATNNDPILVLPPVTTDADGRAMVMARLLSPADTVARLFYTHTEHAYNGQQMVTVPVKKGENLIHMHCFGEANKTMYLRFDPGEVPGEYRLLPLLEVHQLKGKNHGI